MEFLNETWNKAMYEVWHDGNKVRAEQHQRQLERGEADESGNANKRRGS